MTGSQDDLIAYRFQRAEETLEEARVLADTEHWNGCVNRLYYACFYAVSALLLQHGMTSSKHTGIRSFFNLHFVKTGRLSEQIGEFYNTIFTYRNQGDYMDLTQFDQKSVSPWISLAEDLLREVAALSAATGSDRPGAS